MGVGHSQNVPASADSPYVPWGVYASDHVGVSLQQIAEVVVTAATSSVEFTNLPDIYHSLELHIVARSDYAVDMFDEMRMRFNGDSGANYDFSPGLTPSAAPASSITCASVATAVSPADVASSMAITLPSYSLGWKKTSITHATHPVAVGDVRVTFMGGVWYNTSAINQITLFPAFGTVFVVDSIFTLWGRV